MINSILFLMIVDIMACIWVTGLLIADESRRGANEGPGNRI